MSSLLHAARVLIPAASSFGGGLAHKRGAIPNSIDLKTHNTTCSTPIARSF